MPVAVQKDRTVSVNITGPDELAEIGLYAEAYGFTRSGFAAAAVKRVMSGTA